MLKFSLAAISLFAFSFFAAPARAADNTPATQPAAATQPAGETFHVLAIAEGGIHGPYVDAAKKYLAEIGPASNFTVDWIENSNQITEEYLSHYQVFYQANYPPYAWKPAAAAAFQKAIDNGTIGFVGVHHASLLGDFDGYKLDPWWHDFMGNIIWKDYIPKFAAGTVNIEDKENPVMKGVSPSFLVKKEEWYTYDQSPRLDKDIHVIASVDESTYVPDGKVKMGDHPVIWTNTTKKARNIYIFMGHSPVLFESDDYKLLLKNALIWAAGKNP